MNRETEQIIIDLVIEQGYGRPAIMELFPEESEWSIRKAIKKAKLVAAEAYNKAALPRNAPNKDVVEALRPVTIKIPEVKRPEPKDTEYTTIAFVGDTHGEHVDESAFNVACQIINDTSPDILVHLGDLVDFYAVSRFDKDPSRRLSIQEDLEKGAEILGRLDQCVSEQCRKILVEGNHGTRLQRYINKNAPALHDLDILKFENLLGLKEIGWEYVDYDLELFPEFLITHGERVAKHSGYSAKREMEEKWCSGISGHVHRGALHMYTPRHRYINNKGPSMWIEAFCLCDLEPEYVSGTANWQQGIVLLRRYKDGGLEPILIPIVNGRAFYNGKVYVG
jgi:predicted phosphodiesterase